MSVPTFVDVVDALRIMALIERATGNRLTDLERRVGELADWLAETNIKIDDHIGVSDPTAAASELGNVEFNAYINDLITADMKRCAPGAIPVATANNTYSGALAPTPAADDPDAPVLCPNCGAPVRCENCDKMMDWVGPAAAIVRRMRGTR